MPTSMLLLVATFLQDPTATTPSSPPAVAVVSPARLDQVELHGGEVLEGRIVTEVGNYLEIEVAKGAMVGFRMAQVAAIRRGAGALCVERPPSIAPRDEWFTLHDGTGSAVGSLHGTVTSIEDHGTRISEEWEFAEGERTFQITVFADADSSLRPRSCYFRERILEDTAIVSPVDPMARTLRVRAERIVEARVEGGNLVVQSLSGDGKKERVVPFPADATFPLLARWKASGPAAKPSFGDVVVFDPAVEDLRTITFGSERTRRIATNGIESVVDEVVENGDGGSNATWRDASLGVMRREIAGPSLVAVRSEPDTARALSSAPTLPKPFVAEAGGRFGLWLPNPAWRSQPQPIGTVALVCDLHSASITMTVLDHLDDKTPLDAAAAAVERWSALLHPGLTVHGQSLRTVRGKAVVQIDSRGGSGLSAQRARMFVVESGTGFLVLRCSAPAESWAELEADFEAATSRLELSPAAVAALDSVRAPVQSLPTTALPVPAPVSAPVEADAKKPQKGRVRVPMQIGDGR